MFILGIIYGFIHDYIFVSREYKSNKLLGAEIKFIFDESGVTKESRNGNVIIPWSDFYKISKTKNYYIMNISKKLFIILPKRIFGNNQIEEFEKLLKFIK